MSNASEKKSVFLDFDSLPVPRCAGFIKGEFIDYQPGESLTLAFPVLEDYLNPAGTMQGGLITAAFDNVFGPFCLMETQTPSTAAIDIITTYHRPILPGDVLTVTVTLVSKGRSAVHMKGEARDRQNKLIASATTNYIVLDPARSNHPAARMSK